MSVDYTPALAAKLDARRGLFHGAPATLVLLDHARPGRRGYDALLDVSAGWHYSGNAGEPNLLEIAESATVTAELLDKVFAFGINGEVWEIVADGEDKGRRAPTYPTERVWSFRILPTGEPLDR